MNRNTSIIYEEKSTAVRYAIDMLKRDMDKIFCSTDKQGGEIKLMKAELEEEQFKISGGNIYAGDDLGFVYGLLHISEKCLGVPPFWFWYDWQPKTLEEVRIEDYVSSPRRVRFRGWFLNDEILLTHWSPDEDPLTTWRMAIEALLRCGGNMIIPDTQIDREHSKLAASYGLWLTHHHAEPLGAYMYTKAYPGEKASYDEYPERFEALWKDGIEWQKDKKVVWNLSFRGQGDTPFWDSDKSGKYDTDAKRGALISELIQKQYNMLTEQVENPICCTYLYGEIMELYRGGHIHLPANVIKVWSDNGYGKMVSRRIGNDNPRTEALPEIAD